MILDDGTERTFSKSFRIGRGEQCELKIDSGLVSREHAEVTCEDGAWSIRDLGSTNGILVEGVKTEQASLEPETNIQLGHNAPKLQILLELGDFEFAPETKTEEPKQEPIREKQVPTPLQERTIRAQPRHQPEETPVEAPVAKAEPKKRMEEKRPAPPMKPPAEPSTDSSSSRGLPQGSPSMSEVMDRYFSEDSQHEGGMHTQMIRHAYKQVKRKEQSKYIYIVASVLIMLVIAIGVAGFLMIQNSKLEGQASEIFTEMKQQDLEMAQLRSLLVGTENDNQEVRDLLDEIQARRARKAAVYNGYVEELGLYRKLSEEEQLIYQTARIFNESEFGIPAGFVREVREVINEYWLKQGRSRMTRALTRAETNGYTPFIVETMKKYGLPPEFFFLAMQESDFNPDIYGPSTRWGIAKGMWQFIPDTAQRYGLRVGPRADLRVTDEQDDRHDYMKATDAAARYLLDIYSTPAQASGLLVMASYNWGEHRVIRKLENLASSQDVISAVMEGIPEDPNERNYWRFLTQYEDRMPDETKDYVLKIFSAAVIAQDPRQFGFDFDNPLKPYIEESTEQIN